MVQGRHGLRSRPIIIAAISQQHRDMTILASACSHVAPLHSKKLCCRSSGLPPPTFPEQAQRSRRCPFTAAGKHPKHRTPNDLHGPYHPNHPRHKEAAYNSISASSTFGACG